MNAWRTCRRWWPCNDLRREYRRDVLDGRDDSLSAGRRRPVACGWPRRKIDARMADRFLYFAYGSNMLTRRLHDRKRAPSAYRVATGFITGYQLAFDKEGKDKEGRRSGKCDVQETGRTTDRVYGVLFSIAAAEKECLDKAEGATGRNPGYKAVNITVTANDGSRPTALTYIAVRKDASLRPYHWYKAFVVAGAEEHGLPPAYVAWLRTFESEADPDVQRGTENEAVLLQADVDAGAKPRGSSDDPGEALA